MDFCHRFKASTIHLSSFKQNLIRTQFNKCWRTDNNTKVSQKSWLQKVAKGQEEEVVVIRNLELGEEDTRRAKAQAAQEGPCGVGVSEGVLVVQEKLWEQGPVAAAEVKAREQKQYKQKALKRYNTPSQQKHSTTINTGNLTLQKAYVKSYRTL